jgi:hypothetical protein
MLYAILCYHSEATVATWSREQDAAVLSRLKAVREKLTAEGRMGPAARLMHTTAAVTLRKGREHVVVDGPFAETKEQLLGFYVIDCRDLDHAIETAREMAQANDTGGAYEIRPLQLYHPSAVASAGPAAGGPVSLSASSGQTP